MTDVKVIELGPKDILFCRVDISGLPKRMADEYMASALVKLKDVFPDNDSIVMGNNIELSVIKKISH